MDEIAARYAHRGVSSVFVYTREAHPGEHYRHHTAMEDKRANARAFLETCGVQRPILLDDLQGTCHQAYGMLPNMTWIVGRGGVVYYKAAWTGTDDVEDALQQTLAGLEGRRSGERVPFYSERFSWRGRDEEGFKEGLRRAGPQAMRDFYGHDK